MNDYRKVVEEAISEAVGVELKENEKNLDLIESGLLDSLAMMNMVMYMEERTGKRMDSRHFTNDDFRSFNSIVSLLDRVTS